MKNIVLSSFYLRQYMRSCCDPVFFDSAVGGCVQLMHDIGMSGLTSTPLFTSLAPTDYLSDSRFCPRFTFAFKARATSFLYFPACSLLFTFFPDRHHQSYLLKPRALAFYSTCQISQSTDCEERSIAPTVPTVNFYGY